MRKMFFVAVSTIATCLISGCFQREAPNRIPEVSSVTEALAQAETVEFAHLSKTKLDKFPSELSACPRLWKLSLRGQKALAPLSAGISSFPGLRWLDVSEMGLSSLPDEMTSLGKLEYFYASGNNFTNFPAFTAAAPGLVYINLDRNQIAGLGDSPKALPSVRWLRLNNNAIASVPESIGAMTSLDRLYLRGNKITQLPGAVCSLSELEQLDIGENPISSLPDGFCKGLTGLNRLDLDGTGITALPDDIGSMKNLKFLFLSGCKIPEEEKTRIKSAIPWCQIDF